MTNLEAYEEAKRQQEQLWEQWYDAMREHFGFEADERANRLTALLTAFGESVEAMTRLCMTDVTVAVQRLRDLGADANLPPEEIEAAVQQTYRNFGMDPSAKLND